MKFQVFKDEISSSEESNSGLGGVENQLKDRQTQSQAGNKPESASTKKANDPTKPILSVKDEETEFKRLLQQDTPIPQNKENYDYLRKTYSTDQKKSKSMKEKDLCRTPLEDITFHYQSRLKRTLLNLQLNTSSESPSSESPSVNRPELKEAKARNDKSDKIDAKNPAKGANASADLKGTVTAALKAEAVPLIKGDEACEKIEKQLKTFEKQTKAAPKNRKILLMRL